MNRVFIIFILLIFSCNSREDLLINKVWKLEKVYFIHHKKWGEITNCNQYFLSFEKDGKLVIDYEKCNLENVSDIIEEGKWVLKKESLYMPGLGESKIIKLTRDSLIVTMDENEEREGVYYFLARW